MKKINDKTKHICILLGFSVLSIFVVLGVWLLTKEPSTEFAPMPEETGPVTDTWEEESHNSEILIANDTLENITSEQPDSDVVEISSDEAPKSSDIEIFDTETSVSLSDSTTKESKDSEPPKEPPVITDSLTDPNNKPEYDDSVPLHTEIKDFKEPENSNTASVTSSGQVYDPVFGWIQTGNTSQNVVDSSGDINKQIGTMGN